LKEANKIRGLIGVCPQEPVVYEYLTARENLEFYGRINGLSKKEAKIRADELLKNIALLDRADDIVKKFSGGMKCRLNLALAFVSDPEILFLDEPTLGLDPAARLAVWDIIKDAKKARKTVILTTHYMDEADALCDRVGIIDYGKIIALNTSQGLKTMLGNTIVVEIGVKEKNGEKAGEMLSNLDFIEDVCASVNSISVKVREGLAHINEVIDAIKKSAIAINYVTIHPHTLEDVFIYLTGKRIRD
jgi:ABC-2 type transport system ATP-binding protein